MFSLVPRAKSRRKGETTDGRSKPVTGKPTRRDTVLLGLRENNVICIFTDTNKHYDPHP